ncbi:cation diffusion facilitator family transporter [Spelaeicoccus albus]|uniref:Cation diffusion facilitator family transporter n=1 Tax=Spelaeicoccus albus TaxID=1280376 RepID=A0A7Z0D314_9MICO|nr:cation diffusion facilitator family transporter [Spelaeicoccus albus]NYI67949.1 cation diffusion facilitator family transporter [Spelaeicoccus albus]
MSGTDADGESAASSPEGGESTKAIIAALSANVGIAITKFVSFLLTSSSSMLAESIHSVADSGNQILLLVGGRKAKRGATPEHPFGFGRERYVYGFIVSIVLFTVGGLFALYEAWEKWHDPHGITGFWWWLPIVVLVVSIGFEGSSFLVAMRESKKARGDGGVFRFVRTAKAPELPVVLLEDSAAVMGLVFALAGIVLTLLTGDGRWDAAGTGLIGLLLVTVAAVLGIEMKSLLIGEAASGRHRRLIEAAIPGEGVDGIVHMRTMHLGPEELLVAAKIAIPRSETGQEIAAAIDAAEARIREAVPIARVIYLEPDIRRDTLKES